LKKKQPRIIKKKMDNMKDFLCLILVYDKILT
jgi:hypothetical protein